MEKSHHTSKLPSAPDVHPHWADRGPGAWPCLLLFFAVLPCPRPPSALASAEDQVPVSQGNRNVQQKLPPSPNRPHLAAPAPTLPLTAALLLQSRAPLLAPRSVSPGPAAFQLLPPVSSLSAAFSPAAFTKACSRLCHPLPKHFRPTSLLELPFVFSPAQPCFSKHYLYSVLAVPTSSHLTDLSPLTAFRGCSCG